MTRPGQLLVTLLAVPALAGTAVAQQKTAADLAQVQVGVGMTAETRRLLGSSADAVVRAFEAALAREGMGAFTLRSPTRFMLAIDVQQLVEDVTPTAPPLVALRTRVSARFGDRITGRSFAEFSREVAVTGRTRALAYRSMGNRLRLNDAAWRSAAAEANARIINYFETSCEAVLGEAQTMARGEQFEDALVALTSIPREAATCHARAQQEVATTYAAMQEAACGRTFARARARWAANTSRESARLVADSMGTISPGSPCWGDAEALLGEVIMVLASADSTAAEREREAFQQRKREYDDALAAARQRAADDTSLRSEAQRLASAERMVVLEMAGRVAVEGALKKDGGNVEAPTILFQP